MSRFQLAVASALCLCALSCRIILAQDPQASEQPIDLGGYKLNVSQTGSGLPVVVFVSGMGEDLSTWHAVQPAVAPFARTLSYDRAGLGKSDPSSAGKSVESMTSELHALLNAAKLAPPYVLVGHSLGGAIVQCFAFVYPAEVAGLVLVDPEDGRLLDRLQARMPSDQWEARQRMLDHMMSRANPAQKAEIAESRASGKTLAEAIPLPAVPTVLLTGTLKDPSFPGNPLEQDLKLELQNEFLATIPHARHVLVPNSRHYIQEDAPNLVIDAIREVVEQIHGGAASGGNPPGVSTN